MGGGQAQAGAPEWLGLSPTIWLILGGGVVLTLFVAWENRQLARGREPLVPDGFQNNPAVPASIKTTGHHRAGRWRPIVSDAQLKAGLEKSNVPPETANAIINENATARIDGLRSALAVLSIVALVALLFSGRIPAEQPAAAAKEAPPPVEQPASVAAR